jgi:hypothetical protein
MGMYTEIYISCKIAEDIPSDALDVLKHLFGGEKEPDQIPNHPLFKKDRWSMIGRCASFYFVPDATSKMWREEMNGAYYITSRSDLKNYDGEIEAFFDWVMPYVDENEGQFIGYSRYEETDLPTLYVKQPTDSAGNKG